MQPDFIGRLQYRLLELGCPVFQMRHLTRELADHREDLKQAALAEGLTEIEAAAHADSQLGDPRYLAEQKMIMLRQSSWWGRHFIIGFCLLPLLTAPFLWLLFLLGNLALAYFLGYGGNSKKMIAASENPAIFHYMHMGFRLADYLAMAMVALVFCWLARRAAVRFTWLVSACLICSFYSLFLSVEVRPHNFSVGIFLWPHWLRAAMPLLIVGAVYILRQWSLHKERQKVAI
ncbi:MAG TPA: hypothetical protein VGO57_11495 [Verrucomicrobiae bacterium]